MQFPYGPFAPDAGANAAGFCSVADGVLPISTGYGPAPSLVSPGTGTALPGAPRGAITCIKRDGTTQVFFLTVSALYQLGADYSFTLVSNGYACTPGDDWSCEHFGDYLLYTNTTDGLWAYNIETGVAPTYIAAAKDPREIFVVANMVFGLDCKDAVGTRDNRLMRNSDFNDHTDWSGGAADYQPLESGAELVCGVNLKNGAGVVFQRDAMRLIQFGNAGGGAMYSLPQIAEGRGSVGQKSVVAFDGSVYFLATNGFWRFTLGGLEPIGDGFVDGWFLSQVLSSDLKNVQAAIDPARKIVLWVTPTGLVLGYSWATSVTNRWFTWQTTAVYMSRLATAGYTWDAVGALWATWDTIPQIAFNDRFWQGGQQFLAALDANLKFATFSGTAQAATIETTLANSPISTLIGWATPIDDAPSGTLQLGVLDDLSGTVEWKDAASKASAGRVPLRGRGMNIAFRRNYAAGDDWSYAKGVDHIKAAGAGPK